MDSEVEYELDLYLTKNAGAEENSKVNEQVRKEIQSKFDKKRLFILSSLQRAQKEQEIHLKQEKHKRYERMFNKYAFPHEYDAREANRI